jgi:hypothetical protein
LYYISDALICIIYLIGIVAGVIALTRKKMLPGILAVVAFLFFGLEIVVRYVIWYGLASAFSDYAALNWARFCLTTLVRLLSAIALVVVVFTVAGKKTTLPPPPGFEETPPEP